MLKPMLGLPLKFCKFLIPLLVMCSTAAAGAYAQERILLFGAISTTNAITAIAKDFAERDICALSPVFAASSTLARQISVGAPADIFLSANESWMDWLNEKGKLERGSRVDMLGNRLVMIVPADAKEKLELTENLISDLGDSPPCSRRSRPRARRYLCKGSPGKFRVMGTVITTACAHAERTHSACGGRTPGCRRRHRLC